MNAKIQDTYVAPAKTNLTLLVGPRRSDGYHSLCTVLAPLDLSDELEADLETVPPGGEPLPLEVECKGVPAEANLATRAVELVSGRTGWGIGGTLRIRKHIPVAAGLGGGSSDAACALLLGAQAVMDAGGPQLEQEVLLGLALELGADVPFFLGNGPCLATGVGEELEFLELPELWVCLLMQNERLSTAEVYQTFDGVGPEEPEEVFTMRCRRTLRAWRALVAALAQEEAASLAAPPLVAGLMANDLETAASHLLPSLAARRAALDGPRVLGTLLCGSGPTLLGLCASQEDAETVAADLVHEGYAARATRTLASFGEVRVPSLGGRLR